MNALERYQVWLHSDKVDEKTKSELYAIKDDMNEIIERFYMELEFGTAGLRGVIGAGDNRMNVYNVRKATEGLALYLNSLSSDAKSVCIAYDSRRYSDLFARESACVLAAHGIKVYLFSTLHSVPQLSFTIRHLGCSAGIVITASHNPPKYNGYKVYWSHGGQVAPKEANAITEYIRKVEDFTTKYMDYVAAVKSGMIVLIGEEVDEAYYAVTESILLQPELVQRKGKYLKLVYTPLHGSGNIPVRALLERIGVTNVQVVREQELPDCTFPTVSAPNPENAEAFVLAKKLADKNGASVILATDPDSDRLGVAVKKTDGDWAVLTGNQIAGILLHSLLTGYKTMNRLPSNGLVIKSLVSTRLADAICQRFGVELREVLTGFRFISEQIDICEKTHNNTFLFGFEESYGFLAGGFARDKDAICASMLIAEACVVYKERGMTLYDALEEIYRTYGFFKEKVKSYTLEGKAGLEKIQAAMKTLRSTNLEAVSGYEVTKTEDYQNTDATGLPPSNVLRYSLANGTWIAVRPSGTEPKLKLYIGANADTEPAVDALLENVFSDMDSRLLELLK
ncbi:MAG: phospho-sugar mutase [Eubacteriales bacterium]|nr:phospho-sugar mutase [Eubacteriales bacterium]